MPKKAKTELKAKPGKKKPIQMTWATGRKPAASAVMDKYLAKARQRLNRKPKDFNEALRVLKVPQKQWAGILKNVLAELGFPAKKVNQLAQEYADFYKKQSPLKAKKRKRSEKRKAV